MNGRSDKRADPRLDVEFGNAGEVDTHGTGWFIGFSDWARRSDLRYMPFDQAATGLCVKWFNHEEGHPNGDPKPVSEGRSISILVGDAGEFRIELCRSPDFSAHETVAFVLKKPGDFAAWGEGIYHRAFGLRKSSILTIRWIPQRPVVA